jgi:16S rRNA (guanine527-N7)-methyltransferase
MGAEEMISRGLDSFRIAPVASVVEPLCFYIEELAKWNDRVNLVGFKSLRPMVEILLYDTFFLSLHVQDSAKTLDLGSGSGIVAIPLKILCPSMEVCSVDKSLRKIQFQRHIKRTMSLTAFNPIHGRIEDLDPLEVDSLVVKAFGPIPRILEMGRPHIKDGGRAFILKGTNEEETAVQGFNLNEIIPYRLPGSDRAYRLFIYEKTSSGGGAAAS